MTDSKIEQAAAEAAPGPQGVLRKAPKSAARASRKNRLRDLLMNSFGAIVIVPTLIVGAYNVMATDRFAASSSFVVRSQSGSQGGELLDSISGSVSSGSTRSDSYIIRNYIQSADMVRLIDEEFGFQMLFGGKGIDLVQRLSQDANFEDKIDYWRSRVSTGFDHTTGILNLEVQAYSGGNAKNVADRVLEHVRELVNGLSLSAREQSYDFASKELALAEEMLRDAQQRLTLFRSETGITDPTISASRDDELIRELNREIISKKASLDQIRSSTQRPGANATALEGRIASLESQRTQLLESVGDAISGTVITADLMSQYESILMDIEIGQSRYARMLESMEGARRDSDSQQRYLAVFEQPYVADEAEYPRRLLNILLTFIGLTMLYAIGRFVVAMIRDHIK